MRLDQALAQRGLCESRTEAQELIDSGSVLVNGTIITKRTAQVASEAVLEVTNRRKFVSRGGDKLEGALIHIFGTQDAVKAHFGTKNAIDIGSSTGGFTDCLLSYGIHSVTAIDVGTSQLHTRLRNDKRVHFFENTDIRNFKPNQSFDVVVADLSFISLEQIFSTIVTLGNNSSYYFLLIKPQFEVGKGNTKKGIVKNKELVEDLLQKYSIIANNANLDDVQIFPCSITGGDGNQEFFLFGERR